MANPDPIIVIGGGPAGSCVSTLLARRGYSVALLERDRFPRDHVGESLLPASIPILQDLGVLDAVEKAGFVRKRGATMVWGSDPEPWSWYFSETNVSNPHSYQVWRPEFDQILLDNARRNGVRVLEGRQATGITLDSTGRAVGVRHRPADGSGGDTETIAAWVVDASGQGGVVSRQLGLREWDDFFRNLAVYGYFAGGRRLEPPDEGNIFIESQADGWLWNIPLRDGWSSVGAVVDSTIGQAGIRAIGAREFLEAQIKASGRTSRMLATARLVGKPQVLRDWSYRCDPLSGPGYVLVGDAACFIDPLFSSGVHLALTSASLAAALVVSALKDSAMAGPAGLVYQQLYYKEYSHFREMARLFYSSNRSADSYFWEARRLLEDDPALTPRQSFIQAVAGQPARGYERAVLSRGLAPDTFADSIAEVEMGRQSRRATMQHWRLGNTGDGLGSATPRLKEGVRVQRQPVLDDGEFVWGYGLVTDGHPEGLPCSAIVASFVSRLDGQRTVNDAISSMCIRLEPEQARAVADLAIQALQLLYVDGVVAGLEPVDN